MTTRLKYSLPIARQLLIEHAQRLRPGGLRSRLQQPTREKPFVIVTGAGRSGTSAVARVLHQSGVRMGSDFDDPNEFNSVGYFQEREIFAINEEMMAEAGMSDLRNYARPAWRSTVLAVGARFSDRMTRIAASETDGWKDPIFSFTLEAWLPLLPQPLKLIVCLRSPEAYARSVMNIFGLLDMDAVMRFWARHYQRLLPVIRDYQLDATCIQYEELLRRPAEVVEQIAAFVGSPLDSSLVRPDLRRFSGAVSPQYAQLYADVCGLGGTAQLAPIAPSPQIAGRPTGEEDTATYLNEVEALDERVLAARGVWLDAIGTPELHIAGEPAAGTIERTRAASSAYADETRAAQAALQKLEPPPDLEDYHQETRALFDYERLTAAALVLAASGKLIDRRALKTALELWDRYSSPAPFQRRLHERDRASRSALAPQRRA